MPFSYQVVLWKQESFVVLRPLQIEFFRNLLEGSPRLAAAGDLSHFFCNALCIAASNSAGSLSGGWQADPEQSTAKDFFELEFPNPKPGRLGIVSANVGGRFCGTA
jgi:hypothetical protein